MNIAVIPARYGSTRFPGKPLALLGGRSIISRVYDRVRASSQVQRVVVATDDARIYDHVLDFGGEAMMTRKNHPNGTSRVAEVATNYPEAEIVVNVQGDEPFILPEQIDALVTCFQSPGVDIATLAHLIHDERSLLSPNVVKVVCDLEGHALYFSRHAIPYLRDVPVGRWVEQGVHLQHIGLYAFRAAALQELTELPPAQLETVESLEQLRWLVAGYRIQVARSAQGSIGIDTPADLAIAEAGLSGA